jgi:replicative DNA helicase
MTPLQINEHNEQPTPRLRLCTTRKLSTGRPKRGSQRKRSLSQSTTTSGGFSVSFDCVALAPTLGPSFKRLCASGRVAALGGIPHIFQCADLGSASPGGAGPCIDRILDVHAKRQAYKLLAGAVEHLKEGGGDLGEVRGILEKATAVCAGQSNLHRGIDDIDRDIEENLKEIEEGREMTGAISWGIPKLDKFLRPIKRNEYCLVCARPSRGKTSMLTHLAGYNLSHGKRVVFFNLEDADTEIVVKMAAQMARVCVSDWASTTNDDRARFRTYKDKIVKSKKFMVFDRDTTLEAIQTRCRLLVQSFKPELVVIDYLGCLRIPGKSLYESVSAVSKAMPPLRKLLGCPLVVGQQLKRLENEQAEPGLQDLRDSGQLEEDAARAVMLHWKDPTKLDLDYRDYTILQPKYRFGPTTAVSGITFHAPTTTFREANL